MAIFELLRYTMFLFRLYVFLFFSIGNLKKFV